MKDLIFATHNHNKLTEIRNLVGKNYNILGLVDLDHNKEVPENKNTIEGNALSKVKFIYNMYHVDCFADDTGLEVYALNKQPGVYSARFAEMTNDTLDHETISESNIRKLLFMLKGEKNRKARFKTVIALILNGKEYSFEGIVEGEILCKPVGDQGFGYDPVFKPDGYSVSFAQMTLEEKNKISHRANAMNQLIAFLNSRK